jgi:hypothetical protein
MKNTLTLALAMIFFSAANAQKLAENNVPDLVKSSFKKQFPNVKKVVWEKEKANFEAEFELNETEQSAVFDEKGSLIETEVEIEINQLPATINTYMQKNYVGQKIKEAAKIIDANGKVSYEAEIKGMDLIFDERGSFTKVSCAF